MAADLYKYGSAQLRKQGWTEGIGLGRKNTGRTDFIKPKRKSVGVGIGYDHGKEFADQWWHQMFNKAASGLVVNTSESDACEGGKVTLKVTRPPKAKVEEIKHDILYKNFVKGATLLNGGVETSDAPDCPGSVSSDDEEETKPAEPSYDELFLACEGRTAHKAARHGFNLDGKLARIAEQEKRLQGLSASDSVTSVSENISDDNKEVSSRGKPRKTKTKSCLVDPPTEESSKKEKKSSRKRRKELPEVLAELSPERKRNKKSKQKCNQVIVVEQDEMMQSKVKKSKKTEELPKKKKKDKHCASDAPQRTDGEHQHLLVKEKIKPVKSKKKKAKGGSSSDTECDRVTLDCASKKRSKANKAVQ